MQPHTPLATHRPVWHRVAPALVMLLAGAGLAACGSSEGTSTDTADSTATESSAATSSTASSEDTSAAEEVAMTYFESGVNADCDALQASATSTLIEYYGFVDDDGAVDCTTFEDTAAGWYEGVEDHTYEITSSEVADDGTATVDITDSFTYEDEEYVYEYQLSLVQEDGTWLVDGEEYVGE